MTLAWFQTGEEKPNICWLKNLFRENIDWNYINISISISIYQYIGTISAVRPGSDLRTPCSCERAGSGPFTQYQTYHTDIRVRIQQTYFGHFSKNWFSSFFTATKETVGAFFLGTQGLNLASFGFRSPFQSQWKFVSPNWGVQIVYQLHNPFSSSEFVSFNKLVCLNSFPSFTVFYVDHRPEHITWLRRSLIKFWICGAQYWLRW